ncbi:MAG: hypothetical protein JWQ74_2476, partial [Marmoricola sp.]|nr:hypothetical protein [Marmoricola sp.]
MSWKHPSIRGLEPLPQRHRRLRGHPHVRPPLQHALPELLPAQLRAQQ